MDKRKGPVFSPLIAVLAAAVATVLSTACAASQMEPVFAGEVHIFEENYFEEDPFLQIFEEETEDVLEDPSINRDAETAWEEETRSHADAGYAKGGELTARAGSFVITVSFGPEARIPGDAVLSVCEVTGDELDAVVESLERERKAGDRIAASHTFDISILDNEGLQIQPAENSDIAVSFQLAEVADDNLQTRIYHISEEEKSLEAQELDVATQQDTATVVTDGFSYYTVEFTYGQLTYVMQGYDTVPLRLILEDVGLFGEPDSVRVSDEQLLEITGRDGEWTVTSLRPFTSEEWLRVMIGDIEYEITLTDAIVQQGDVTDFAMDAPVTTILLDYSKISNDSESVFTDCRSDFEFVSEPETTVNYNLLGCACYTGSVRMNADNEIPGDCFYFTFEDAAILADGTRADLRITYSDVHIYTPPAGYLSQINGIPVNTMSYTGRTAVALGRTVRCANENDIHIGLGVDVNVRIVNKDGTPAVGTFYFSMNDIDVQRNSSSNYARIYDAASYDYFSEQVRIISGALSPAYIPGEEYKSLVSDSSDPYGNGVSFEPRFEDADSYLSGFIVVADACSGINLHVISSGGSFWNPKRNKVDSHLLSAYSRQQFLDVEKTWLDDDDSSGERPAKLQIGVRGVPQQVRFDMTGQGGDTQSVFTAAFYDANGQFLGAMVLADGSEEPPPADLRSVRRIVMSPAGIYAFTCHVDEQAPNTLYLTAEQSAGVSPGETQSFSEIRIDEGYYRPETKLLSASMIRDWSKNGSHWQASCEIPPGWYDLQVYEEDLPQYISTDPEGNPAVPSGTRNDPIHVRKTQNNRYTAAFYNKKLESSGAVLPYTGGYGTYPFAGGGMLALAAAGLLYPAVYRRKRRNGKERKCA